MSTLIQITIPVLNEAVTISSQIQKIHNYIADEWFDSLQIELVIADNGSTDQTPELARALEANLEMVRYVRVDQRGVGAALKAAWLNSDAELVGYMDLDLATDLDYLKPAIDKILTGSADIVSGSRLAEGASVFGRKALRTYTSICFNQIVKLLFNTSFTDGMCGFKFLRRKILPNLIGAGATSDGWIFATEILITGEYLKYRVVDLPVSWTDSPDSKVKIMKLAIEYIRALLKLKAKLREGGYSL
ncbi:MAG: glycosyltransferase [Neptuniibacter sp.]